MGRRTDAEPTRRERMKMPRTPMPERDGRLRSLDFDEVNLGYTDQLAILEANRCLHCARPVCVDGCPVGVRIGDFVAAVAEERFDDAARIVSEDNSIHYLRHFFEGGAPTPHIEKLAAHGLTFDHAFSKDHLLR